MLYIMMYEAISNLVLHSRSRSNISTTVIISNGDGQSRGKVELVLDRLVDDFDLPKLDVSLVRSTAGDFADVGIIVAERCGFRSIFEIGELASSKCTVALLAGDGRRGDFVDRTRERENLGFEEAAGEMRSGERKSWKLLGPRSRSSSRLEGFFLSGDERDMSVLSRWI